MPKKRSGPMFEHREPAYESLEALLAAKSPMPEPVVPKVHERNPTAIHPEPEMVGGYAAVDEPG